ncbi:ABC transporter permease [Isoptericola sp. b441]|uniref:ABC transporter permease n=1 Tax=Actinotalea lenta TaxID=3064654 RepID=A0ABT9DBQ0_9CELL|nr:ABC transporter permease [Isoptericola sp. b441]MDO8106377.1 ABC transporter permease [Isoptericola sp. b441]
MSGVEPIGAPVPPGDPGPAGDVIHDLGFRHYDGPRLGRGWVVRSLLVETVRGVFGLGRPARSKIMPWVLIGILLAPPLVLALSVLLTRSRELPLSYTAYPVAMQLVVTLFVAGAAPYCVSRDLRHGVMPLYLSRPMTRADYVLAKVAGLSLALFAVLASAETLLLVGALLAKLPVGDQLGGWAGGLVTAAVLSVLLAVIGLVVAAVTPRRGLGVAAIITGLVVITGVAQLLTAIASERGYDALASYLPVLDPYRLVDALAVRVLGVGAADGMTYPAGVGGALVLAAILAAVVAGGLALLVRRYRKGGGL